MLSNFVKSINPSPTVSLSSKAKEIAKKGKDVVNFSVGDPAVDKDFPFCQKVKDAGIKSIEDNLITYTPANGLLELREEIAKKTTEDTKVNYTADQVSVSCGAKQALFNLFMSLIDEGDEVIVPAPYWVSYVDMITAFKGKAVIVKTKFENRLLLTPEELKSHITPKTKCLILNSPSNPTGSIYTQKELEEIGKILEDHPNIIVICDDIYEHIVLNKEKQPFVNFIKINPNLKDRVIIVNGTAKSHAMTGWRVGYAIGNTEIIKALNKLQSQTTTNACTISQYALIAALQDGNKTISKYIPLLQKRLKEVQEKFSKTKLKFHEPDGAFYIFCSIEEYIGKKYKDEIIHSCSDFSRILLENKYVALVPGVAFGYKNYFRLSLGLNQASLSKGLDRIIDFLEELR